MGRRLATLGMLVTSSLLTLGIAAPAAAAASYASTDYVALGDSYSSGVGAPGQSILCFQSKQGYPGQWAARNKPKSFTNLSCGGAETGDVRNLQVPLLSRSADLISITIGGNDAGFASTVLGCQVGTDASCAAQVTSARTDITSSLPAKLDATYGAIKRKAPDARVIVLGYPTLFDTSSASCGIAGMSLAKRRSLNEGAQVLNDVIAARAAAAGFTFSDVRDEFAGHGICSSNPYLHGLTVVPPQNSFHPNLNGYTNGYLPALISAL
ncbi:SGNH/GDSL hydrolase family protein [Actinoplanes sp. LDG1-06]|uniref:SGNH/GDSL hydrolase family protein n=1 Tax=Paractinoplanes ovalisporus TaxID=2810368 RepID=A0ABS2AP68_9ACTN|nr:SGNH/GDSL hydrolase family protein [Actinoplanes ovalisporus]MBM2621605.1 SGNH/GDSL hydrolase family protein [Actinoplanes ovalisporus]